MGPPPTDEDDDDSPHWITPQIDVDSNYQSSTEKVLYPLFYSQNCSHTINWPFNEYHLLLLRRETLITGEMLSLLGTICATDDFM